MRLAVTGSSGFVGKALVRHLAHQGHHVRALTRHPIDFGPGVEVSTGDVLDKSTIGPFVDGVDVVFHLAALLHKPDERDPSGYHEINVGGTRNVLDAMDPATRLVLFSSIGVYGPGDRTVVFTEASPTRPVTPYAKSKVEAEHVALQSGNAVALRVAAVYGPRMKGNFTRLFDAISARRFFFVGDGLNRRTLVHIDDVCRAAEATATTSGAQVLNVTDGQIHALRDIANAIAISTKRPSPRLHVPVTPVRVLSRTSAATARLLRIDWPFGPDAIDKMTEDVAVAGDTISDHTDFSPRIGLVEGWASVAAARAGRRWM